MKLEKYEDKSKKKRKVVLISLVVIVLISVSLLLYKTFAVFNEHVEFPMMNGKVDYFGNSDIYFAFYQGDKELDEMPQKNNKENLVFDHAECDNGASIEWNSEEWAPLVKGLNKVKTKCSLYFEKATPIVEYVTNLAKIDTTNLIVDNSNDSNLRYVGADSTVNNYIDIGDRDGEGNPILWRIIGVMNNITNLDNGGQQESLVKIIRAESIGNYSWDSSTEEINKGWGINEWSQADLMKLLNPNTVYNGTPEMGGSLYWNRGSGSCYNNSKESSIPCDFTSSGLSEDAKIKIAKVKWNIGTSGEAYQLNRNKITAKYMYEGERSNHNGKEQCESNGGGTQCNDDVPRTTTWDGYIGLIYPSDYGYAVGGSSSNRNNCLEKSMISYSSCENNDWLKPRSGDSWTMTSVPDSSYSDYAFILDSRLGDVDVRPVANSPYGVWPVAYLKSSTRILPNSKPELEYGSQENPFVLE